MSFCLEGLESTVNTIKVSITIDGQHPLVKLANALDWETQMVARARRVIHDDKSHFATATTSPQVLWITLWKRSAKTV